MAWKNEEDAKAYRRAYYLKNKSVIYDKQKEREHTQRGRASKLLAKYKREDKNNERGECTLTQQWIIDNIFNSKCHYCGESDWRVLGCDRINNDLHHTPENVVCACYSCNTKRCCIPQAEFMRRMEAGEQLKKNRPDLSKPVAAKDAEENIVFEFPSTREAGRNGFNAGHIAECCRGERKTHKGLFWFWA